MTLLGCISGVNPGGWWSRPPDFWQGAVGSRGVVKYYYILFMYRKYVRKW